MKAENDQLLAPLARRHWVLGMQGSVASADFFGKLAGGHYFRQPDGAGATSIHNGFVINNLIPRPEPIPMPTEDGRLRLPPPDSVPVLDAAVPVVNVRGSR
jgi:hypothetical protein